VRPISGDPEGLPQKVLHRCLRIEEHVSFLRDYFLKVVDKLDFMVIVVVPITRGMVPSVSIVVA
jgi:hypothetical protein